MTADLLLASNRGPVSFADDGSARRGGGGLVSAIGAAGAPAGTVWVCAALSDADRRAARASGGRILADVDVRMLDIDPVTFDRAYNAVANSMLWFVSHLLYATPSSPAYGERSRREWAAFVRYDDAFASALAQEAAHGAAVLVQDYHLSVTPRLLRERRPDLRIGHFSHTPWAPPEYFRLLPDPMARDLLTGLLGADSVGFHSRRWADAFARCCVEVLGATYDGDAVHFDGRMTSVDVHPLGVDGPELLARAREDDVAAKLPSVRELVGGRQLLLRIDRTELSKNIVRGLEAYRELLRRWPEHRERVVHLAFAYPSRHDLPEYREYTGAVQRVAREVNEEFATPGWLPVHLEVKDDYPRSLAAMRLADVLVVNPLRDGMNLVAKEGPVLSEHGVGLVLSREAGAADDLGADALLVNPFDISQTAEALNTALSMDRSERFARSRRLAEAATAFPPSRWLADQLASLAP
ncbi:MAG: trehalose-6-phosphate synthase [Mycobacteriales bacterium]